MLPALISVTPGLRTRSGTKGWGGCGTGAVLVNPAIEAPARLSMTTPLATPTAMVVPMAWLTTWPPGAPMLRLWLAWVTVRSQGWSAGQLCASAGPEPTAMAPRLAPSQNRLRADVA